MESNGYETASSYTSPPLSDGTYSYTIVAVDESGNESGDSPTLDVTIDSVVSFWNNRETSKLLANDGAANDRYGNSVCISGTLAIVGAYCSEGSSAYSLPGSAYIFQQTANGWEQVVKLIADDGITSDYFGYSVSISGTTAIVGAYGDDDRGSSSGSAYIFQQTATGWEQVAKLIADDAAASDYFGTSVSISGTTAIVGANGDDDQGSSSGSAYIFQQTVTGWEQVAKLTPDDAVEYDWFGDSVCISGTTAIVGARGNDANGDASGAAYIFQKTATGWEQITKLVADDAAASDYFGTSVSISGTSAIVGANYDDDHGGSSGSAYIFQKTATGWEQIAKLTASDGSEYDHFGESVSISGTTVIVGAYADDDSGSSSGSAYIFQQTVAGWRQAAKLTPDDGHYDDYFGWSVSISGTAAIAGAYGDDDNGTSSGSAYMFSQLLPIELQATSDTGISNADKITTDTSPTFDIVTTPYYRLYRDGVQIGGDYEIASTHTSPTLPYGTYEYNVQAIDAAGNETPLSVPLTVTIAPPPSADAGETHMAGEGDMVTLDASSSTTPNGDIIAYEWDFDGDELYDDATGATVNCNCFASGTYNVAVRVTDSLGLCDTDATTVTVNNVAPTADVGGAYVCAEGGRVRLDASASTDPGDDIVSYEWDLDGDGLYDDASGVIAYFDGVSIGNYPVSVRVTDEDGAFDTADAVVEVRTPQTITVTSLLDVVADDGFITLREAIAAANTNASVCDAHAGLPGMDRIVFAPSLFEDGPGTILFGGNFVALGISDDIDIQGPGPELLTIDGNGAYNVFSTSRGLDILAKFHGLTITGAGGRSGNGITGYESAITVSNCVITGNASYGILNYYSTVTVTYSTISGNQGGGIHNAPNSELIVINSAIINNVAGYSSQGIGGGITNYQGTVAITNCTITGNSANTGGGIYNSFNSQTGQGTVALNNTIVAGNQATYLGADLFVTSPATFSGFYNLIGDGSCQKDLVNGVDGNQIGTTETPFSPRLGSDGFPLPNSPVIDAGSNALAFDADGQPLTLDLTGNGRIFNGTVDIGAYEVPVSPFYPGDANLDGRVDGADVTILAANWQVGVSDGQTATWSMGDFNGDGKVDGSDVTILAGNWQAGVISAVVAVSDPEPESTRQFIPPAITSLAVATVPRRESLPRRRFISPMSETIDAVLTESTWSETDYTAIAKDIVSTSVKKSDSAINRLFTLELDPYMDYE